MCTIRDYHGGLPCPNYKWSWIIRFIVGFNWDGAVRHPDLIPPVEVIANLEGSRRIIETVHCDVPLEILLAVGRFDPTNPAIQQEDGKDHTRYPSPITPGGVFDTWSYETDRPFSLSALRTMVRRELPGSIYRCKGIVFATEHPEKRLSLQTVGRRTGISELDEWGDRKPRTRIVAIGAPGSIDEEDLKEKFEACIYAGDDRG